MTTISATAAPLLADLVDSATIAEMAGVSRSAVSMWGARYADFPEPLPIGGVINPIYSRHAVRRWLIDTGRIAPEKD